MTGGDESADDATRFSGAPPRSEGPSAGGATPSGDIAHGTIPPGTLLGHTYRIERRLARGGMGEIYRARHAELGTEHAIKIILPELADNPKVVDLFRREASVLRNVRDDAVVAYDGVFRDENGRLYLVMEFVEGPSLSDLVKERPLRPDEVRKLRDRLARGLAAAHQKGVVHRDISPDNVILPGGRLENAKIIDFGIAKLADPGAATIVGDDFAGKYSFVSPEQLGMFGGVIDARSDIYSLGLVLAAAAAGEPLDMGMSPISVIEARRSVPDLSRVPPELRDELSRMLQPDPADRPQSMRDLIGMEAGARQGESDGARAAGSGSDGPRHRHGGSPENAPESGRSGRGLLVAGLVALGVVAVAAGGALYFLGPDRGPTTAGAPPAEEAPPSAVAGADESPQISPVDSPGRTAGPGETGATPAAPPEPVPATSVASTPVPAPEPEPEPIVPLDTTAAVATPPAPEPEPDPEVIRAAVEDALRPFACADLSAVPLPGGRVRVAGHLASEADRLRLDVALSAVPGGPERVIDAVAVRAWPACLEAVSLLQAYTGGNLDGPSAPRIRPDRADGLYREGDRLIIEVAGSPVFNQYLYVDYIDSEGEVVHLFPSPKRPDNRVEAGGQVILGAAEEVYRVGPPFGPSLIFAIASPRPLFEAPRDQVETAEAYLSALRRSFERLAAEGMEPDPVAGHIFTTSIPK